MSWILGVVASMIQCLVTTSEWIEILQRNNRSKGRWVATTRFKFDWTHYVGNRGDLR